MIEDTQFGWREAATDDEWVTRRLICDIDDLCTGVLRLAMRGEGWGDLWDGSVDGHYVGSGELAVVQPMVEARMRERLAVMAERRTWLQPSSQYLDRLDVSPIARRYLTKELCASLYWAERVDLWMQKHGEAVPADEWGEIAAAVARYIDSGNFRRDLERHGAQVVDGCLTVDIAVYHTVIDRWLWQKQRILPGRNTDGRAYRLRARTARPATERDHGVRAIHVGSPKDATGYRVSGSALRAANGAPALSEEFVAHLNDRLAAEAKRRGVRSHGELIRLYETRQASIQDEARRALIHDVCNVAPMPLDLADYLMGRLTPRAQIVLQMALLEGLDQTHIAYQLGTGQGTVSKARSEGLDILRTLAGLDGYDPIYVSQQWEKMKRTSGTP